LFEDEYFVAVNKPAGLNVHPTPARPLETSLETLMREKFRKDLILFHRLDRDTTGIVLFGKRRDIAAPMTRLFAEKKVRKSYLAVVEGKWQQKCNRIEQPIKVGEELKKALTTFRVLSAASDKTWIEALPKTGRKHQIRVHCMAAGHAILGDRLYHPARDQFEVKAPPHALHAYRLDFRHPVSGADIVVRALPPDYWKNHWLLGLDIRTNWSKLFGPNGVS
jgi:RluA family pseudouridine synthase